MIKLEHTVIGNEQAMERLTKRGYKKQSLLIGASCNYGYGSYDCQLKEGNKLLESALNKLADYEDLEEQNKLLKLPCKVGDMLYYPEKPFDIVLPIRLNEIIVSFSGIDTYSYQYNCCSFDGCGEAFEDYEFDTNDFGKTVFLTKAEAEAKLKELRGGENEV